jgi:acyl-CoA thioester hydrolase
LHYPGQVKIASQIEYINNTSFSILHHIFNENDELAAEAADVMVLYDYTKKIKAKFPEDLKSKIENH